MCTNLRLCDNCKNRNIQCCICTDNNWHREGNFSHDKWVRNKTIDEFAEALYKKSTDLKYIGSDDYGMLRFAEVYEIAEELKGGGD